MNRIELFTNDSHFVAVVEILPFPAGHEPEVVIWGDRVFAKRNVNTYVEVFAFVSLTPSPGLPRAGT